MQEGLREPARPVAGAKPAHACRRKHRADLQHIPEAPADASLSRSQCRDAGLDLHRLGGADRAGGSLACRHAGDRFSQFRADAAARRHRAGLSRADLRPDQVRRLRSMVSSSATRCTICGWSGSSWGRPGHVAALRRAQASAARGDARYASRDGPHAPVQGAVCRADHRCARQGRSTGGSPKEMRVVQMGWVDGPVIRSPVRGEPAVAPIRL